MLAPGAYAALSARLEPQFATVKDDRALAFVPLRRIPVGPEALQLHGEELSSADESTCR